MAENTDGDSTHIAPVPQGLTKGPLAGVRVLDFSRQFAGALGTRILGGYGAEILRVEWPEPPGLDFVRMIGPADGIPGFNRGGMFNGANMDKRSFTLNMATEEGRDLAKRLVAVSDVVYENMTPRVMKNWGMDYESLKAIKHDLIYVSCSGFGQTGPTSHYRSYGSPSQAHAGIVHLAGIPGKPPAGWGFQIGDTHAGAANAIQVLMALHHHSETGRGVFIDAAQTQGNATLLGQYLLDQAVNGHDPAGVDFPPGNKRLHPRVAPHNVYPCFGDDKWCAIAVLSNEEWTNLVSAIGSPAWALDGRYATAEGRWADQETIDRELSDWTLDHDRYHVARRLQSHGVRAGVVQDAGDRLNWDRQLAHRGTYAVFEHPEVGLRRHETMGAKLSRSPYEPGGSAPLLGEHNHYVFSEVLGLTDEELAGLEERDTIRTLVETEA
jgi:crotonobetainyl-CoA:carnitine CoA-transferase CaiB-like acyl-CoA transferase